MGNLLSEPFRPLRGTKRNTLQFHILRSHVTHPNGGRNMPLPDFLPGKFMLRAGQPRHYADSKTCPPSPRPCRRPSRQFPRCAFRQKSRNDVNSQNRSAEDFLRAIPAQSLKSHREPLRAPHSIRATPPESIESTPSRALKPETHDDPANTLSPDAPQRTVPQAEQAKSPPLPAQAARAEASSTFAGSSNAIGSAARAASVVSCRATSYFPNARSAPGCALS